MAAAVRPVTHKHNIHLYDKHVLAAQTLSIAILIDNSCIQIHHLLTASQSLPSLTAYPSHFTHNALQQSVTHILSLTPSCCCQTLFSGSILLKCYRV